MMNAKNAIKPLNPFSEWTQGGLMLIFVLSQILTVM